MTGWDRRDAEMAIALKRAELNRALGYKTKYDAEGHNLCLALVTFRDGTTDVLAAYSNDGAIPESVRLGLNLIPGLYASLPASDRFGCGGMAQFHTEPKLLNYLCATPALRRGALRGPPRRDAALRWVLERQRGQAIRRADLLQGPEEIAALTLITEIDCCPTCTRYSINRFRARFPVTPPDVIELSKRVADGVPPAYRHVTIGTRGPAGKAPPG